MTIENRKELIARISRAMKKQYEDAESLALRLYGEKDPPIWVTHSKED